VFFLNKDLKGHDMMWLKARDQFLPLKENWVNYVIGKQPQHLGEGAGRSLTDLGVLQPDLRQMRIPPLNKFGAAVEGMDDWAHGVLPAIGRWATTNPWTKQAAADPARQDSILLRIASRSPKIASCLFNACQRYPMFKEAFESFHGPDALAGCLLTLRSKVATSEILAPQPLATTTSLLHGTQPYNPPATKLAAVKVITKKDQVITENLPPLEEHEQDQLKRDGFLVRDLRKGEQFSRAYDTQIPFTLTNPTDSGICELLEKPGKFTKALVILGPHTSKGRKAGMATVIRLSDRKLLNASPTTLWVKPELESREDFQKWVDEQSNKKLQKGGTYVLVDSNRGGDGTCAFTVNRVLGKDEYEVSWDSCLDHRRPNTLPAIDTRDTHAIQEYRPDRYFGPATLVLGTKAEKFRALQHTLYAPHDVRIFRLRTAKENESRYSYDPDKREAPFIPGSRVDLQMALIQKMASAGGGSLKLKSDGQEVAINSGQLQTKRAALFSLILGHGLAEDLARELLKQADVAGISGKRAEFYVKYADGYPYPYETSGVGPQAPAIPEPQVGSDPTLGYLPTVGPEQYGFQVPPLESSQTDMTRWDMRPEALPDPQTMQGAQQAAQTGQKDVFDVSALKGLIKTVGHDDLFDEDLKDLFDTLNRLGRMRFLFYWHNDDFENRYGKQDLPDLEDSFSNVFDGLGDLVLWLSEKTVNFSGGGNMLQPSLADVAGN
jgi:hypothetical protein